MTCLDTFTELDQSDEVLQQNLQDVWNEHLSSKDQSIFFCRLISKTIDVCLAKDYHLFDAHTTTNCCHGIAVLGQYLISKIQDLDLSILKDLAENKILELESSSTKLDFSINWVPSILLKLASFHLLATSREIVNQRQRTDARNLKKISPVGSRFCWAITNDLKKTIANSVAHRYRHYLAQICPNTNINGTPIHLWGNYVQPNHIRVDKENSHYAPCIFSIQVSLAYLIKKRAKIVLINDIIESNGSVKDRYIRLLEGDGDHCFTLLSEKMDLSLLNPSEPVIAFSGYIYSDTQDIEGLSQNLEPWLEKFPCLMLACDIFYPQFPGVRDDPDFDSSPIVPKEKVLQDLFSSYAKIEGVSHVDPSLFCAAHIYLCSLQQIITAMYYKDFEALPACFHGLAPNAIDQKNKVS